MIVDLKNMPEEVHNIPESKFKLVADDVIHDEIIEGEPIGYFKDAFIRFRRNKASIFAFWLIVIIVFLALVGPSFNDFAFNEQNVLLRDMPPRIKGFEERSVFNGQRTITNRRTVNINDPNQFPPDSIIEISNVRTLQGVEIADVTVDYYKFKDADDVYFWFGSDYLGRDLFTRLFRGVRVSLLIAVVSVTVNVTIGVIYGSISGYLGGRADMIMMRICEVLGGIPYLVMVMLFILMFGTGIRSMILALTVTGWIGTARLTRTQFLRYRGREYVLAARTLGVPDRILIFRHILPNAIGPLITRTMVSIPGAIFSESFLAYLGLGLQPPEPSIGILLSHAQKFLLQYPYQIIFPSVLISVLMISFNLFANGLRDALDPTQRGGA